MKIKTNELTGAALDWAVASIELKAHDTDTNIIMVTLGDDNGWLYTPSRNWAQGGPIIERGKITVVCAEGDYNPSKAGTPDCFDTYWVADIGRLPCEQSYGPQGDYWGKQFSIDGDCVTGPTPLIAAMRCFCRSKLGDEVDIPDELTRR